MNKELQPPSLRNILVVITIFWIALVYLIMLESKENDLFFDSFANLYFSLFELFAVYSVVFIVYLVFRNTADWIYNSTKWSLLVFGYSALAMIFMGGIFGSIDVIMDDASIDELLYHIVYSFPATLSFVILIADKEK